MRALVAIACLFFWAPQQVADFRNIAEKAGLRDPFPNGGASTKQYIVETTGSGVAFLDYDNDGLLDIFIVSGKGGTNRLYHNEGNGRFNDVTERLGLRSDGWGQGVCAGDYDNDGYTDLFVTYWGQNRLYRNAGGRRFEDVTAAAHLTQDRTRYNTGCSFLDYNNDGRLDLFVANYLKFDPATTPKPGANPYCWYRDIPVNCGPRGLAFDRNILYRGNADGTFTDVSEASKIAEPFGHYALGVVSADFNGDGRPDIYVACDQTPSLLYINQGDGSFSEEAVLRGVAFDENGKTMSGMGVTTADYDGDGAPDIFRSNFSDERETLYHNRGKAYFDDVTAAAGLAQNTRYVGWGCGFFDFDNDGWNDLLLVNGHAFPEVDRLNSGIRHKNPMILYRNTGKARFEDISNAAGTALQELHPSRGAAFGDIDNDGSLEVLVNNQNETPSLLKQSKAGSNHWIIVQLTGTRSNRSAIGARVRVSASGRTRSDTVMSGGSFLSQNDLRLHFGLAATLEADSIEIQWPSGGRQRLEHVKADRVVSVREQSDLNPQ